ncbi:MAG: 50S ribosome-binding GTPase [Planctomycetales bacterium]
MSRNQETFVCHATPVGRSALATLLVRGPQAIRLIGQFLVLAQGKRFGATDRILFGHWRTVSGEEVVVGCRDEQCVEIHCHGGPLAVSLITEDLCASGCRMIDWRQWSDDPGDALRDAARIAIADARCESAAIVLLDQYQGALSAEIEEIVQLLGRSDERAAVQLLDRLLAVSRFGLHLTVPWRVVLGGRPNAGKSSLINAMVGYDRSIVFDEPGTTRDVVTVDLALDGWPFQLVDTAGLRSINEQLESTGVEAARKKLSTAELQVLVFDGSISWTDDDQQLLCDWPEALVVHNKMDIASNSALKKGMLKKGLWTSAVTREGVDSLIAEITNRCVGATPLEPRQAVPFTKVQVESLQRSRQILSNGDHSAAAELLASLLC